MAQAIVLRTSSPISAIAPQFEGQKVVDTTNNKIYIAYGLTNADWQEVGSGGGGGSSEFVTQLGSLAASTVSWDTSLGLAYELAVGAGATGTFTIQRTALVTPNYLGNVRLFLKVTSSLTGSFTLNGDGDSSAAKFYYVDNRGIDTQISGFSSGSIPITTGKDHLFEIELGGSGNGGEWCLVRKVYQEV